MHETTKTMTARAEEIAAEEYPDTNGPDGETIYMEGQRQVFVKGYNRGQQDRWISVEERLPEDKVNVLVAGYSYNRPGADYWQRTAAR